MSNKATAVRTQVCVLVLFFQFKQAFERSSLEQNIEIKLFARKTIELQDDFLPKSSPENHDVFCESSKLKSSEFFKISFC